MPKCLFLQYSAERADLLESKSQIQLDVNLNDMEWADGLEYVVLFHGTIPHLVGKISGLTIPAGLSKKVVIEFCEARNAVDNWGGEMASAYRPAFDGAHRSDLRVHEFPNTDFFTLGAPFGLVSALDRIGAVTLKTATALLADTYGVDESQVTITISN